MAEEKTLASEMRELSQKRRWDFEQYKNHIQIMADAGKRSVRYYDGGPEEVSALMAHKLLGEGFRVSSRQTREDDNGYTLVEW